jgi:hypothetical protein
MKTWHISRANKRKKNKIYKHNDKNNNCNSNYIDNTTNNEYGIFLHVISSNYI